MQIQGHKHKLRKTETAQENIDGDKMHNHSNPKLILCIWYMNQTVQEAPLFYWKIKRTDFLSWQIIVQQEQISSPFSHTRQITGTVQKGKELSDDQFWPGLPGLPCTLGDTSERSLCCPCPPPALIKATHTWGTHKSMAWLCLNEASLHLPKSSLLTPCRNQHLGFSAALCQSWVCEQTPVVRTNIHSKHTAKWNHQLDFSPNSTTGRETCDPSFENFMLTAICAYSCCYHSSRAYSLWLSISHCSACTTANIQNWEHRILGCSLPLSCP